MKQITMSIGIGYNTLLIFGSDFGGNLYHEGTWISFQSWSEHLSDAVDTIRQSIYSGQQLIWRPFIPGLISDETHLY